MMSTENSSRKWTKEREGKVSDSKKQHKLVWVVSAPFRAQRYMNGPQYLEIEREEADSGGSRTRKPYVQLKDS